MGIARTFPAQHTQRLAGQLRTSFLSRDPVFISVCDRDKYAIARLLWLWRTLVIASTHGRYHWALLRPELTTTVNRISDGHPNVVDLMRSKSVNHH